MAGGRLHERGTPLTDLRRFVASAPGFTIAKTLVESRVQSSVRYGRTCASAEGSTSIATPGAIRVRLPVPHVAAPGEAESSLAASAAAIKAAYPLPPTLQPAEASDACRNRSQQSPAKRPRLCAGPQPQPPLSLRRPAAAHLLLQAVCTPFDISLEPGLQLAASRNRPTPAFIIPASLAEPGAGMHGRAQSGSSEATAPSLLPVFAHPAAQAPTPGQASLLAACRRADTIPSGISGDAEETAIPPPAAVDNGGSISLMAQAVPQPAVLVGYQDEWLEVAPSAVSMWQQVS